VRWECGQSARVGCECHWVVNKCTYCVYTVRCTRNGHARHPRLQKSTELVAPNAFYCSGGTLGTTTSGDNYDNQADIAIDQLERQVAF